MRFTESWRSVKTDAWGISALGVEGNPDKLNAALALIDFAFSPEGQILMSYGPDAFIKTNADGSYSTFVFNGKEMPEIADATYAELWEKAGGNYTNYARQYLGSTLSFAKSQAFEFQCTTPDGKEGAGHLSTAIALGTIKHPELAVTENPWYTIVPTVLPIPKSDNDQINSYTDLIAKFSATKGDDQVNVLDDIIVKGLSFEGFSSVDEAVNTVANTWNGSSYLYIKDLAWADILDYYSSIG